MSEVKKYQNIKEDRRGNLNGLKRVLSWAQKHNIPCILETPAETISITEQLNIVNSWADSF